MKAHKAERKPRGDKQVSVAREELQKALCGYTSDTLNHIETVREFCDSLSMWVFQRKREVAMMMDIKDRADKLNLKFDHVTNSKNKGEAFLEFTKSKLNPTVDTEREELEKGLATVLTNTLEGLEELHHFLDAVERLAVTSLHVFMEQNQVLQLPQEISLESVQAVIISARLACPLLLELKRDASAFFFPSIHNVEVLVLHLDMYYIYITQKICEKMEKSSLSDIWQKMSKEMVVHLAPDMSENNVQSVLCHINQLIDIRMDQHFRLMFLFQEVSCSEFISEFSQRQPRMMQFLSELEDSAVQLDRMKMGAKISSVAGSSVGVVAGVLSIVGLALIPVTAGVSTALIFSGLGLGITSGVNSAVTAVTEIAVNNQNQNKAHEALQSFMEDVRSLQDCLEEVSRQTVITIEVNKLDVAVGVGKVLTNVSTIGKGIDSIVDAASAVMVKSEDLITSAGKVAVQEGKALRGVSRVASDIPDVGQAAVKGSLALSKSARAGLITLNALFLGLDIFFICKDSVSLAKGAKSDVSQFIRARAALWRSELDSWQRIHDSLNQGLETSKKSKTILEMPFYPEGDKETQTKSPSDPVEKKPEEKQICIIQ